MCEPATIGYTVAALVGGYAASRALAPKIPDGASAAPPAAAAPPAPTAVAAPLPPATQTPAQAAKAPDVQALKAANTTRITTGRNANSTMLTGPTGVDMSTTTIGKNTLLGM